MRLLYNPFKKKKENPLWNRIRDLGNFTWKNRVMIDKLNHTVNELQLMVESLSKPKKRGRPRKNG